MINALDEFRAAIQASGLQPPDIIEPGKLYRFPGIDKNSSNTAGWCQMFTDGLGGSFGDWSSDFTQNWQAKSSRLLTPEERHAFHKQVNEVQQQAQAERLLKQNESAIKAAETWQVAIPVKNHPYLTRKNVQSCGLRLHRETLVIPLRDGDKIYSLQFIEPNGDKRFLTGGRVSGCYYSIGSTQDAKALCIVEGFATGATIHQATALPVAVAFNAGNLIAVAKTLRQRFADLPIVICADDDASTLNNPGITKAKEAAKAINGLLAVPDFGKARPEKVSDFNDLAQLRGLDAVSHCINNAITIQNGFSSASACEKEWPEPQPLIEQISAQPYPLDALPPTVQAAVQEVQSFTKAPIPLVASSALAALSLTIQSYADVKRAEKLTGPVSLFLLTIADSGERKSSCDGFFTRAIQAYEQAQAEAAQPALKDHHANFEAWEAKRAGIKEKIRQLSKSAKPTVEVEKDLRDLEHQKPLPPRVPRLLYTDATPEALSYGLAKNWPSGGICSAEAGIVFGSHGMGKDSAMRNMALLNILWDGSAQKIDRRSSDSFTVRNARLTMALQVQEATLRNFFGRSGELARGTGFLARFLVAWPESTQGSRPFTEAPINWPALEIFEQRITEILKQDVPIKADGGLVPGLFSLSEEAKKLWVIFHDKIESQLSSGGELYDVRDVASKTADNAVRLAALFQVFEYGGGDICAEAFISASRIAAWHLNEAQRFCGEFALPPAMANASRLQNWLINYCRQHGTNIINRRFVQRCVSPIHLRDNTALMAALQELSEAGHIREVKNKKQKDIHVNPALLMAGDA